MNTNAWSQAKMNQPMKVFRCILFGLFAAAVPAPQPAAATPYAFNDAHLLDSTAFTTTCGDGYIVSSEPLSGGGVSLTLMLGPYDDGKTQFGDGYPLAPAAGMGWDDVLWHWSSLAAYSGLALNVHYASGPSDTLDMALYMNTGLTGESGNPSWNTANNTFWSGGWQTTPRLSRRRITRSLTRSSRRGPATANGCQSTCATATKSQTSDSR